jgi:predicted TPR repeat methyltransferase
MLAALNGSAETTPASDYVRDLFDQYSDSFEQSLVEKLEYRVPELLAACLAAYESQTVFQNCIDLGCGTGLAGVVFRHRCSYLCGVDLSRKMVELAADKQLYDQLLTGDVVQFLLQDEQQYDLFVAADLLTYLADLESLFQAVAARCRRNGLFVFSTEKGSIPGWQVRPTGRFAHHQDYIVEVARKQGAQIVSCQEENLRKEGADWVRGELYIVRFNGVS